jgi:hypothetical protein
MPRRMPIITIHNIPLSIPLSSKLEFFLNRMQLTIFKAWNNDHHTIFCNLCSTSSIAMFFKNLEHPYITHMKFDFSKILVLWIQHFVSFTSTV